MFTVDCAEQREISYLGEPGQLGVDVTVFDILSGRAVQPVHYLRRRLNAVVWRFFGVTDDDVCWHTGRFRRLV